MLRLTPGTRLSSCLPRIHSRIANARRGLLGALLVVLGSGCGMVFQGKHQTIHLHTAPTGAQIAFNGQRATSPATMVFRRRELGWTVFRAKHEGFHPACVVIGCGTPKWIKVLNSLPLGIPWIFDASAGTHRACRPVPVLHLRRIEPGEVSYALPSDHQILHARRYRADICAAPHMFDPGFNQAADRVLVTTGNLQRPYVELGAVDFGKIGSDITRGTTFVGGRFAFTTATRTFSKATPAEINRLLQLQALYQYGDEVDAVINVAYDTNPRNDVFGTGLAVRFVEGEHGTPSTGQPKDTAGRLQELDDLRGRGLISEDEYERLRADVLRDF